MKRTAPIIVLIIALVVEVIIAKPWIGEITETLYTENGSIKIRVENRAENWAWLPGAYYIFKSQLPGSNDWSEIMTFRDDDLGRIPRENVRFVNDKLGYVFMGWMYAVTTDGGASWSVWDGTKDLPEMDCCGYALIKDVRVASDGKGVMILNRGVVPELRTNDFGRHWNH